MSKSSGAVLIMAGGTGGHIFPGLAVAESLRRQKIPVRWLGAKGGMECQYVPAAGFEMDVVEISGLRGKGLSRWLRLPFHLLRAVRQAFSVMGEQKPVCALSFGGFAAGPGGLAARLRGIPLLVHEQNRIPGLTNKVLARMAQHVFQAFPGTWPAKMNAISCGNPVRSDFTAIPEPAVRMQHRMGRPRLLVTGGSQGAMALNRVLPDAIAKLSGSVQPEIIHQSGKGKSEEVSDAYTSAAIDAQVFEFIDDMAEAYAWADLVVCRSGALTISELAAAGLGSILVPYPHAVDDHQTHNAGYLVDVGAGHLMPETHFNAALLSQLLEKLLGDRPALVKMAEQARSVAIADAADRVADTCREYQVA